ncbi:MAG: protein kinase [Verrucomicrobia bacterium]|nr:protein kinase [Verrucomicrobiota bacterium]
MSLNPDNIRSGTAAGQEAPVAGTCPVCGRSLTQLGSNGECLRCLFNWGLEGEQTDDESTARTRRSPTQLKYAEFQVEVGADGLPIELGAGAMAVTYRAWDTVLNCVVALKVIERKVAENPAARSRFLREARAAAQIHHPNVARVSHYGEQDGECFYAMELVDGETLEARVRRDGPLPLDLALNIIEQAARALAAAEACGVVHRDIKPSNIMLESDAIGAPVVKVIDYGVAKVLTPQGHAGAEQTQAGFIGTPAFASPEQFAIHDQVRIDTRSDIYSLGITFWYLLAGRTPFVGTTLQGIREQQTQKLPWEQLKGLHIPAQCFALLKSMLAPDRKDRPQTARDLLSAIHRCNTKFSAEGRSLRRLRFALTGIGLVLVVAIALGTWSYRQMRSSVPALPPIYEKSIAVLPFENRSEDKANAYFTDGVQDEILTDLAKIADLKVVSRSSVMQYKSGAARNLQKIAEELGVAHVVEGSVQRDANKVRVNVQLVDARNDAQLWAQTYDRDLADVFAIQSEIAESIAEQLQAKLSPPEKNAIEQRPTVDSTAFEQYSRAKTLILETSLSVSRDKSFTEAIDLLNHAVERDPSFHAAFCELVWAQDSLYAALGDHTPTRLAAADAALKRATELRPNAAETHLARGAHLYLAYRDYKESLIELEAARAGLPNDPRISQLTGFILRRQGKHEEGIRVLEQSVALDPRNPFTLSQLAVSYIYYLRRYAEGKATYKRVLAITPDDVGAESNLAIIDFLWRADTAPFHKFIDRLRAERPASVVDAADNWFDCALAERDWPAAEQALTALGSNPCRTEGAIMLSHNFGEGLLARAMRDEARARKAFTAARLEQEEVVQKQKDYGPALCVLGLIDAALGNKEAALQEGRHAMELLPVEKDSINAQKLMTFFALIATWAGEKDLALQQLATAAATPGSAYLTSYGALKLSPFWDPLRGDPRFEEIVTSFAPKEASK